MPKTITSTQQFLPISKIENDMVILNNGSLKAVLRALPINFDLKSDVEQNAIIYGYQSFLNSLQFPVQIVVRSKKLDLERYLIKLESQIKNINNNLLIIQAQDYIGFVRRLIQIANIMSKHFYVIISYQNVTASKNSVLNLMPATKSSGKITEDQLKAFGEELTNRTNIIASGLASLNIKTERLNTQELIELFYNIYNPDESMTERLAPVEELESEIIESTNQANTEGQPNNPNPNPPTFKVPEDNNL